MKKREQGILTVEASIVLTLMLLFILFLFSFGRVYRAQNLVSHATLQSADAVALESYLRETALQSDVSEVVHLASHITESSAISAESLESLRSANLPKIARQKFIAAIASSEAKADEKLKSMGVKNGLAGVDFSECKMDLANDDVIIAIKYTIEMQFPVFGFNEITVTKAAKAKTFGEILFEVSTEPNQPGWGSTSGDDKVVHGSTVQITATPNYGYKFVSWDDGNTDNPRTVTVTDAQHYIAIFERDSFGVNISTKITYNTSYAGMVHTSYGTVSGAGNYLYLENATITATPADNYEFDGWDFDGDGIADSDKRDPTRTITVDKTYDVKAIFRPAKKTVSVKANNGTYGSVQVSQGSNKNTSISVEYGSKVQLSAWSNNPELYLFEHWSNSSTQNPMTITVKDNVSYEAEFITNTYTVNFYNGNSKVHTTTVIRGSSIDSSRSSVGSSMPSSNLTKSGGTFDKWKYNGSTFNSTTKVNGNINVYAAWKYTVTLNANGGSISGSSSKSYTVYEGGSFNFDNYTPSRNGFSFNGWYNGSTKYSGNKSITSNITLTASWSCKHYYDDGNTMYQPISTTTSGDGKCSNAKILYRCSGCGAEYTKNGKGKCEYDAWCGFEHSVNNKYWYCTHNDAEHYWNAFGCKTCKHCGKLENEVYWGISRSRYVRCVKHNGHLYYSGTKNKRPVARQDNHVK